MSNKTERQLKELRRLMPWTWDARIEKHPPGEKSLEDFEYIYATQDQPRTRKLHSTTTKTGGPGTSSVNNVSTGRQQQQEGVTAAGQHSHGRRAAQQQSGGGQQSSERRSGKRASPGGQPSLADKAGRECKAARLQAEGGALPPSTARQCGGDTEAEVEATPAGPRRRPASPMAPPSASTAAATPAGDAHTPGAGLVSSAGPHSVLASCSHHVALTGGQAHPTPATAAFRAAPPTAIKHLGGGGSAGKEGLQAAGERRQLCRQLLQSSSKELGARQEGCGGGRAAADVCSLDFRSPAPRTAGTSVQRCAAAPAPIAAAEEAQEVALAQDGPAGAGGQQAQQAQQAGPCDGSAQEGAQASGREGMEQLDGQAPAAPSVQQEEQEQQQGEEEAGSPSHMEIEGLNPFPLVAPSPADPADPLAACAAAGDATAGLAPQQQQLCELSPMACSLGLLLPTPPSPALLQPAAELDTALLPAGHAGHAEQVAPLDWEQQQQQQQQAVHIQQPEAAGGAQLLAEALGLQTATPSQGPPLPDPPHLSILQPPLLPCAVAPPSDLQQHGPQAAYGEGGSQQQQQQQQFQAPAGGGSGGDGTGLPPAVGEATPLAAPPPHLLTPALSLPLLLPPSAKRPLSATPAVGSRRPPRHNGSGSRAGGLLLERSNSAPLPFGGSPLGPVSQLAARQGKVLTAISMLPGGAATAELSSPAPAVPLFQAGSTSAEKRQNSTALGKAAAAFKSVLTVLPNGPHAHAPMAAATAAAAGRSGGAPVACPPLFKRGSRGAGGGPGQQEQGQAGDVEMADAGEPAAAAQQAVHKGSSTTALTNKENRCGNAAAASTAAPVLSTPPGPPLTGIICAPAAAKQPRTSWPSQAEPRCLSLAAGEQAAMQLDGAAAAAGPEAAGPGKAAAAGKRGRAGSRALAAVAVAAAAAAPAMAAAAAARPRRTVSAWRAQQLAALNQSQHARERQLLGAVSAGQALMRMADVSAGLVGSPPNPPTMHLQPQAARRGGVAGGAQAARPDMRPTAAALSRASRAAAGHGGSTLGVAAGSRKAPCEVVMGGALARACALLLRNRLSQFPAAPAARRAH